MSQGFFNVHVYTKQKINLTWPNVTFLAILALHFHSGVCTTTTSCFKIYSSCKNEKKLLIMPVSLLFSQHWN